MKKKVYMYSQCEERYYGDTKPRIKTDCIQEAIEELGLTIGDEIYISEMTPLSEKNNPYLDSGTIIDIYNDFLADPKIYAALNPEKIILSKKHFDKVYE